ncbi:MAG: F0F1 ATP synthase subunit B' [Alphaproteobacteria bacterium]|nr:F0F1 ATP synthase subunit B' [Alphaproteobacteria bacterium]
MPQLEVSTFVSQIFWLIVCFSLLYYLLSKKALPRVAEILEARADRVRSDLDEAQRLKKDAEDALGQYEQVVAQAQNAAQAQVAETMAKLQAAAAEAQAKVDEKLAKQIAEAEGRIAKARADALSELDDAALTTAQAAAERLAGVKVTKTDAKAALSAVLKEAA